MATHFIDQQARDMARQAISAHAAHEKLCAERWEEAKRALREIKLILAWGVTALIGSLGSVILLLVTRT